MKFKTLLLALPFLIGSCAKENPADPEEIRLESDSLMTADTASVNSLSGKLSFAQLATYPNKVILTGMPEQRLITIYRKVPDQKKNLIEKYSGGSSYYYDDDNRDYQQFFMPGIDVQFGYNLVNVGHYNFATEEKKLLFDHPVLVRSLYYPSFEQDSLHNKPINRNYYLISVYNEDTNRDTLINKHDLRRFIYFNATATQQMPLIPANYSVERSQYDSMRDVMYVFARQDSNNNGRAEPKEPLHVFWFSLAKPEVAKRMY